MYTKKVGAKPDFAEPVVLTQDRGGTTIEALCRQVRCALFWLGCGGDGMDGY